MFIKQDTDAEWDGRYPSFAVANLTGGVGKTTTARVVDYVWSAAGTPLSVFSIDSVDKAKTNKLKRFVDGVQEVLLDASDREVADAAGHDIRSKHWSLLGDRLFEGGCLFDFGANAVQRFIDWVKLAQPRELLEDAPPLNVLVPLTANDQSASDALWTMKRFLTVEPVFMPLRLVAVFNNCYGSVAKAEGAEVVELRRFVEAKEIPVVTLPKGFLGVAERYGYMDLSNARAREFATRSNDTPMGAQTNLKLFTAWLKEAAASMAAAGLGPKEEVGSKEKASAA